MQPWTFPHHITHPRVAVCLLTVTLAAVACLSLAGCGGEDEASQATTEPTATAAPEPTPTPQEERPWAFRGQRGITAAFPPSDIELYRSLLPESFDMPDEPLVVMSVVDYYDVTLPLVPYHEGYVLLRCEYQGRTGWHVLTMPVDDETANTGGRAIGFPKYVADEITLEEQEGGWTGRVVHGTRTVMEISFILEAGSEPVAGTSNGGGDTVFNLVPPGEGPGIMEVNSVPLGLRSTVTTSGSATVRADSEEPWAGLLGSENEAIWAIFEAMTGDWILQATERE